MEEEMTGESEGSDSGFSLMEFIPESENLEMECQPVEPEKVKLAVPGQEESEDQSSNRGFKSSRDDVDDGEIEDESQIVAEVLRIKEILHNSQDVTESVLYEFLRRLQLMCLTVETLKATEIGKAVNGLRKHWSKQIRNLARTLIDGWKDLVDEWVLATKAIAGAEGGTPDSVNPSVVDEVRGQSKGKKVRGQSEVMKVRMPAKLTQKHTVRELLEGKLAEEVSGQLEDKELIESELDSVVASICEDWERVKATLKSEESEGKKSEEVRGQSEGNKSIESELASVLDSGNSIESINYSVDLHLWRLKAWKSVTRQSKGKKLRVSGHSVTTNSSLSSNILLSGRHKKREVSSSIFMMMTPPFPHKAVIEHSKTQEVVKDNKNREYLDLIWYCSLFPIGYEFERDALVQLWIAEEFIWESDGKWERMEDTGRRLFDYLLNKECIVPSTFDHSCNQLMYKINRDNLFYLEEALPAGYYSMLEDSNLSHVCKTILHLSLCCKDIGQTTFDAIKKCEHLHTLLFFCGYGSCIKQVPRDLFMSLKLLRTLDLSLTRISELPSTIGNVKSLRYLDVSKTPIKWLPESLACLHNLQTLKLRGCLGLLGLPKGLNQLINLRHLILDIVRQLVSMPKGMGKLTNLQTLQAFLVGEDDGCRIGELKDLNNLSGTFCILQLENISKFEEAEEASLSNKKFIEKLELQWSDIRDEKAEEEEEVLECLLPPFNLKELKIISYGGSKLPSWIGFPFYADLVSISLYKCRNCQIFPSIGELPSLKFLYINEMNGVKEINISELCQGHCAFPKLEKLAIDVMLSLEEWKEVENGNFPCLLQLTVECCPELVTLPSLSYLNSLKHLEISHCPKLPYLPKEGLPTSLDFLLIRDCPVLKERCSKEGEDWPKIEIANVRSIWIDNQQMSLS